MKKKARYGTCDRGKEWWLTMTTARRTMTTYFRPFELLHNLMYQPHGPISELFLHTAQEISKRQHVVLLLGHLAHELVYSGMVSHLTTAGSFLSREALATICPLRKVTKVSSSANTELACYFVSTSIAHLSKGLLH